VAGARGAEAGTCEHVMRPRLQLVRAAYGIEGGLSGLEASPPCQLRSTPRSSARLQVVCVVEAEAAALVGQLVRREALERRLRGHGHEDGQRHRPVGQMQRCSTRFRDLAASDGRMAGWKRLASNILNICPAAQTRAPTASEQAPWLCVWSKRHPAWRSRRHGRPPKVLAGSTIWVWYVRASVLPSR
jgi:hypothetical protein